MNPLIERFGRHAPSLIGAWIYRAMNRIYQCGYIGRRMHGRLYWLERLCFERAPGVVDVERFGLRWRLHRFGNVSESRLLRRPGSFEAEEVSFVLGMAGGDFVFVDVGANCGFWSLRVAKNLGATVIAVEPQPEMLERLRYNARINDIELRSVLDCVVGDHAGSARLEVDRRNLGRSRVSDGGSLVVEMRTLLEIVVCEGLDHVDAIKVDVEGHEDRVLVPFLRDAPDALLPRVIVAECSWSGHWHDDWLKGAAAKGYQELKRTRNHNVILVRER